MRESKIKQTGYELCSVNILQTPISYINHRGDIDPKIWLCGRKVYPVIVAPMGAVTNEYNYKTWLEHGFICVVPRTVDFEMRLQICRETFCSFSLKEAEQLKDIFTNISPDDRLYICIDIAHGTMNRLYEICKELKERFGKSMVIMTGNVANPEAYTFYAANGIDMMRLGIGTGSRCITTSNTGIHYPSASLIDDTAQKKSLSRADNVVTLIADGGIKNFDEINKCLCLGADAVMSGNIFARSEEACEDIVFLHPDKLNQSDAIPYDEYFQKLDAFRGDPDAHEAYEKLNKRKPYRLYYGMSTKLAQRKTGGSGKQTSEGIIKYIPVEFKIEKWAENMEDYLKSCMSYCGCLNIDELKENSEVIINLSGDGSYNK